MISMVRWIDLEKLASLLPNQHRIIRMMPNTPASYRSREDYYAMSPNCRPRTVSSFVSLTKVGLLIESGEGYLMKGQVLQVVGRLIFLLRCLVQMQVFRQALLRETALKNGSSNSCRRWTIGPRKPRASWGLKKTKFVAQAVRLSLV